MSSPPLSDRGVSSDTRAILLGSAPVVAIAAVAFAWFGSWHQTADFTQLWAVTHAAWSGVSPYDEAAVKALAPRDAQWPVLPWAYPPWTTLMLAPLGLLSLDVASRLWMLSSAGALLASGLLVSRARERVDLAVSGLFSALSLSALGVVVVGQLVAPVAIGAALLAVRSDRASTAVGLVLLATKPHLGAPIALAAALRAAAARDRRFGEGLVAGLLLGALLGMASLLLDPRWPVAWPAAVQRLRASETVRICDTCSSAVTSAASDPLGLAAVGLLALVLAATLLARRDLWRDRSAAVSTGVLGAMIFLPYVRNYDHALLAIPLLAAWHRADRARRALLALAWLLPWLGLGLGRSGGAALYWIAALVVAGVWASLAQDRGPRGDP